MPTKTDVLRAATLDIRLSFNLLRTVGDGLLADLGLNASMSAVLEHLADGVAKTVPAIARSRGVSRQHIQVIANKLTAAGLIEARDNPDDKRTSLISLSPDGRALFDEVARRQTLAFGRLSEDFSERELRALETTMRKFTEILKTEILKGEDHA